MENLITVEEALRILDLNTLDFGVEQISLEGGIGRFLMEDIIADRDFPPYDRVTMDGVAIRYSFFNDGQRDFVIKGIAPAGAPQMELTEASGCMEVMTGSILPKGVDTVIRYEDITIENGKARINLDTVKFQQNIHFQGEDRKQADLIIPKDTVLSSAEIGVCATVGKKDVKVASLPKTIIISTGDELVEIGQNPLRHQVRQSNIYTIKTALEDKGIKVDADHLDDNLEIIKSRLGMYVNQYHVIILSGGVSKGKFDYLPQALEMVGVSRKFHRIKQRPGKPFWFGMYEKKCAIFAFPGNPVSSFVCAHRYFNYWLNQCLGINTKDQLYALLTEDVMFKPDLTYFLEVKIEYNKNGQILASPVKGNGSGDLANLIDADAFIELPRGKKEFKKGEVYSVFFYR
ncbi:MAG: molybdopterin molybdotransferase MoeA [Bacteroidota bacterium]